MCTTKAPKVTAQPADEKKKTQYMSNPWVDGLGTVGADARGRNSLRIDFGTARRQVTALPPVAFPGSLPPFSTSPARSGSSGNQKSGLMAGKIVTALM